MTGHATRRLLVVCRRKVQRCFINGKNVELLIASKGVNLIELVAVRIFTHIFLRHLRVFLVELSAAHGYAIKGTSLGGKAAC